MRGARSENARPEARQSPWINAMRAGIASQTDSNAVARFQSIGAGVSHGVGTIVTVATRRGGQQRIPRPDSYRAGRPPQWAALASDRRRFTLAEGRARLAGMAPAGEKGPS